MSPSSAGPAFLADVPVWFLLVFAGISGAVIGSFLNVCIHRMPRGVSVVTPRSNCPRCHTMIPWYHDVPVVSWFLLRGRGACCGAPISPRYPFIEALTAGTAVFVTWQTGATIETLARFFFLAGLIVLFFTDLDLRLLPNKVTIPWTFAGLALAFVRPAPSPISAIAAAAIGYGVLFAIAQFWRYWRGIEAVGGGDIKMLAMMGAFLGVTPLFIALFVASCFGAIAGCGIAGLYALRRVGPVSRRGRFAGRSAMENAAALFGRGLRRKAVPFGCFLATGSVVALFFGERIAGWYLSRL